jgi:hypothetical protein
MTWCGWSGERSEFNGSASKWVADWVTSGNAWTWSTLRTGAGQTCDLSPGTAWASNTA